MSEARMSISADQQRALYARISGNKVLSNAFRLTKDADTLFGLQSFASCVALAALAFEVGKHLLERWRNEDATFIYDRHPLHQAKQDAVASFIACDSMRREYVSAGIDFSALMNPEECTSSPRPSSPSSTRSKAPLTPSYGARAWNS